VLVAESATMQLEFVNAQRILKQATAWGQQELGENAAFQRVRSQHVLEKYPVVAMAFAQGILPMYASAVMGGWEQTAHLGCVPPDLHGSVLLRRQIRRMTCKNAPILDYASVLKENVFVVLAGMEQHVNTNLALGLQHVLVMENA